MCSGRKTKVLRKQEGAKVGERRRSIVRSAPKGRKANVQGRLSFQENIIVLLFLIWKKPNIV